MKTLLFVGADGQIRPCFIPSQRHGVYMSPIIVNCHGNAAPIDRSIGWKYATNQLPNLLGGQVDVTRFGIHTVPDGLHFNSQGHEGDLGDLRLLPIAAMHFLLQPKNQRFIPQKLCVDNMSICFWSKFHTRTDLVVGRMFYEFGEWRQGQMSLHVPMQRGFNIAIELPIS